MKVPWWRMESEQKRGLLEAVGPGGNLWGSSDDYAASVLKTNLETVQLARAEALQQSRSSARGVLGLLTVFRQELVALGEVRAMWKRPNAPLEFILREVVCDAWFVASAAQDGNKRECYRRALHLAEKALAYAEGRWTELDLDETTTWEESVEDLRRRHGA